MANSKQNFKTLQAFEAISRHLSVSKAADELGVTQSAVSHQMRRLTEQVGEKLLEKSGRSIALTLAGEKLARKLQAAFSQIEKSVAEITGVNNDFTRLAVCSSFAQGWLVPKLDAFYATNSNLNLKICMYAQDPELTDAIADAFVTTFPYGPGFWTQFLQMEQLVPVAARPVAKRFSHDLPLITTELDFGKEGNDWRKYIALAGLPQENFLNVDWQFASHYVVALDMVKAGLGAALVPDFLVRDGVESGDLAVLNETLMPTGEDYYLCIKESRRREAQLDALARWFKATVAKSPAK
jgi:LysR family glycine cleavage system transcriptional activator